MRAYRVLMAAVMIGAGTVRGQDTNAPAAPPQIGQQIWDAITSGQTNWFATADAIYASTPKQLGAEAALVYKINKNILVGPRLIYFENALYIGSVNLTLQAPFNPIKSLQWLTLTPLADVGSGYDSKAGTVLGIVEAGGAITAVQTKNGRWKAGLIGLVGKYTTVPGRVYTFGPYLNFNF